MGHGPLCGHVATPGGHTEPWGSPWPLPPLRVPVDGSYCALLLVTFPIPGAPTCAGPPHGATKTPAAPAPAQPWGSGMMFSGISATFPENSSGKAPGEPPGAGSDCHRRANEAPGRRP